MKIAVLGRIPFFNAVHPRNIRSADLLGINVRPRKAMHGDICYAMGLTVMGRAHYRCIVCGQEWFV